MRHWFEYCLFGLTVRSEIELPELLPADAGEAPDIEIELGTIPHADAGPGGYQLGSNGAGFVIDEVAAYWVSEGARVIIEPCQGAPMRNVRLYLLGSAMGVLLHQRGLLPLHANAIEIDGQALAFMGPSGVGKSTLAAAFQDRGFQVVADDVCVIGFDHEGRPHVSPGIPRLRLWEEALEAGGRATMDYQLSYAGDESFRKFDVPIVPPSAYLPLAAIYRLVEADSFDIRALQGAGAAEAVFANTYRGEFVRASGESAAHWTAAIRLLKHTRVFELRRPKDFGRLDHDLGQIVAHARQFGLS